MISDSKCKACGHLSHDHEHHSPTCNACGHSQTCPCECHKSKKYSDELLRLADLAWMEAVKDGIKEEILRYSGQHIKALAKLVSESNHKRWQAKLEEKKDVEEFEDELRDLMHKRPPKK
jgi:hypothetical protein